MGPMEQDVEEAIRQAAPRGDASEAGRSPAGQARIRGRGPAGGPDAFGIVAIGASAGGLEACTALVGALPPDHGLAIVLVQHLEPTHDSMMVELLAAHTAMAVEQAADGALLQPNHLYVIPPGCDLRVANGVLRLSELDVRPGVHLRCDVLLDSLAQGSGPRTSCVILSGTGSDGSLGIQAVKANGGFVIAQDPGEAAYADMPESAIRTGSVDLVLPAADIPRALIERDRGRRGEAGSGDPGGARAPEEGLAAIIDLLRDGNGHDFSCYKEGTMRRQIERRMAMKGLPPDGLRRYLAVLREDREEIGLLARDLLIQVTSFFRDQAVFDRLADAVIPDLIRDHPAGRPIRVWVAGCSTGEETYSLAMLFQEKIRESGRDIRLQMFGSDLDAGAIVRAREGLYPATIEDSVSEARLARCFSREPGGYRVSPELRAAVVFTIQDVLADPPFAQQDLVSCRNLLIYLQPAAQVKVLSLLHFALRQGGILILGNAETVGGMKGGFEVVSKPDRLYRRIGRTRLGLHRSAARPERPAPAAAVPAPSRQSRLAEAGRRLVLEAHAPASILIDGANRCLLTLGPIERYLRPASGHAGHDVLTLARPGLRTRLRAAIDRARGADAPVVMAARMIRDRVRVSFDVEVQPVTESGERLLLVCFVDAPEPQAGHGDGGDRPAPATVRLERELKASRSELQKAIRDLDRTLEDHRVVDEEARSVNEEYQSTNEELMASKEELQSLNEELVALNSQLQETLERQRVTSDDLQNVLYSTDVATLFLDLDLRIRFFTPATRLLFSVIPGDVGRPLVDLRPLASDDALEIEARRVLGGHAPLEREIEAGGGTWYRRRILPYHTHDGRIEGVVITFNDITSRRNTSKALEAAKREAEAANAAKSRFLAAASHDLRQPLQTLTLLQGLLARTVEGERAHGLVARMDETLTATSSMLNTLLDINQIEDGEVRPELAGFVIDGLLRRMRDEFDYHAQSKGLRLHVVPCGLSAVSDVRLLEQMVRNLLANALKYTARGKILLGCRRHRGTLTLEVWDTGVGIPQHELDAIFDEYHQVDNAARERSRGLGLGLSIVRRLGLLLGHRIAVRSSVGRGSVFSIEVPLGAGPPPQRGPEDGAAATPAAADRSGSILIVEDDPDMRDLLAFLLTLEGYGVNSSPDGQAALDLVAQDRTLPDLLLVDYNLPGRLNGLQLVDRLRRESGRTLPAIVLTGDLSSETAADIAANDCLRLDKPVTHSELTEVIRTCLAAGASAPAPRGPDPSARPHAEDPVVFVVDDDAHVRRMIQEVLEQDGHKVESFATAEAYLDPYPGDRNGCVMIDAKLPGLSGMELLHRLVADDRRLPVIMITGHSDVPLAVDAMKAGAVDFIGKPISARELLASVGSALGKFADSRKLSAVRDEAADRVSRLTSRQHEVMIMVLAGNPSKNIAADLHISQRTVENHRASVMKKMGVTSLPALARLAVAAAASEVEPVSAKRHP